MFTDATATSEAFARFMHALLGVYMWVSESLICPSLIDDILQLGVCDFPRFRLSIFDGKEELSLAAGQ